MREEVHDEVHEARHGEVHADVNEEVHAQVHAATRVALRRSDGARCKCSAAQRIAIASERYRRIHLLQRAGHGRDEGDSRPDPAARRAGSRSS